MAHPAAAFRKPADNGDAFSHEVGRAAVETAIRPAFQARFQPAVAGDEKAHAQYREDGELDRPAGEAGNQGCEKGRRSRPEDIGGAGQELGDQQHRRQAQPPPQIQAFQPRDNDIHDPVSLIR